MGKSKEEDKIEKIIRGLLKLPPNRRCINCNSLGPQYVCTTFWTFVCTNCSGVHREFTHRVKSVSMAKFTSEEVSALQAGGNEQARQIYFKTWDPVRHGFPESGNINRLRNFLKHVYVDRKFTSEGPSDKLPGLRLSDRDDSYDCHGLEERSSYHGRCVDKSTRFYFSEGRSPRYYRETSSPDSNRRIPSRIEVANNRHKDVDAAVLRRSATQMFTTADIGPGRSLVHSKNRGTSSPHVVRHVRAVLGEKFLALRVGDESRYGGQGADVPAQAEVGDHPRPGDSRNFNGSALAHKAASSSTKSSGTHVLVNDQSANSESYTDARRNPRPDDTSSEKQMQKNFVARDCNNLVTSEPPEIQNTSVPKQNTLEFLLFELSSPAAAPTSDQLGVLSSGDSHITRPSGNLLDSLPSDESHASDMVPTEYMPTQPHNYGFLGASSVGMSSLLPNIPATFSNTPAAEQASGLPRAGFNVDNHVPVQNSKDAAPSISSHTMVPTTSFSGLPAPPASISTPTEQLDGADPGASTSEVTPDLLGGDGISGGSISDRTLPGIPQDSNFHLQQINVLAVAANNQEKYGQARTPLESNVQGNSSDSVPYSQSVSTAAQNESSGVGTQHSAAETKSNGRKELPADFFTLLYPSNPTPPQGWQTGPHYGMSFNMHSHPAPMQMPGFPNASMSRNPFDLNDKTSQAHPPIAMFPSMTSLHGALPNVSAPAGISTSNFGSHNPVSEACMRQPPFSTMEQHQFNTMPLARPQGVVGFGAGGEFRSLDSNQQPTYGFSATTKPNSFPTRGGNPFG